MDFLRNYAGPTGARASILLMAGGLVVLGFLFLIFIFRSAVVGDVAPSANRRGRAPTVHMPPATPPRRLLTVGADDLFTAGRQLGRKAPEGLDDALGAMAGLGLGDPIILRARADRMHVRVYASGDAGAGACEHVRGYLVGALERLVGSPVKVDEVACRARGSPQCEFLARHPLREVKA